MANGSFTLDTKHGLISITDTALKNSLPTLLLIHGNTSSSKIFRHIQENPTLTSRYRIVTFDLPGHGASSKAPDPNLSYSMRGYADLAVHILQHLRIEKVVVLGWSLGGHVGIEMVELLGAQSEIKLKGLMIVGTPPALGLEQVNAGFSFENPHLGLPARQHWTDKEAEEFARQSAGEPFEQWMEDCAKTTDGRARMLMWKKFAGNEGADQRSVVEKEKDVIIAVVNGGAEPYVSLEYLEGIKWGNLWREKCVRLEGLKHAPFWEKPDEFAGLLGEFLGDCEKA